MKELIVATIDELKKQNKKAICHIAFENPERGAFKELGINGKEIFLERYKESGLSGRAIQYELP